MSLPRRAVVAVALSGLLAGCTGKTASTTTSSTRPPGLPRAVEALCQGASQEKGYVVFFDEADISVAKSWGGAQFSQDISTWLAATDSSNQVTAKAAVARDCRHLEHSLR